MLGTIIGLDGVPYNLLEQLSDDGVMPKFADLRDDGYFRAISSSIPANSAVSWSSMITGVGPGVHGVYGYTDIMTNSYVSTYHSSHKLRAEPFWRADTSHRHLIFNLPASYPAMEMNGMIVSGFVSPDLDKAVYPRSAVSWLKEMGYKVDVDASRAKQSDLLFFKELNAALEKRLEAFIHYLDRGNWDVTMFVVTGTDRLEHYYWDAYADEGHDLHAEFLNFFRKVDEGIRLITSKFGEDTPLLMLSDHGMEGIDVNVNVNAYLKQQGYLQLGDDPKKSYNNIKRGTKAFCLESARIYINKEGKFPRGSVTIDEEPHVIEHLIDLFRGLERDGEKVVKDVYRGEELYKGGEAYRAPDLVLIPNSGFNLGVGLTKDRLFEEVDNLTGKHTEDDAFLYLKGLEGGDLPEKMSVENVLSVFNKMIGVE